MSGRPLSLILYAAATALLQPLVPLILDRRARRGKEDPARLGERLGRSATPRPEGRLVWLHGASIGESLSLLPLVEAIRRERPETAVLVTSGTRTSAELLAARLPAGAIHQYAPVDAPSAVRRFLDHWCPDLAVFVESELWPNLILGARARGTRLALLSAKLSEASFRNWSRLRSAARALLGAYDLILVQDARAAERFAALGVATQGLADLKFGAPPLPADPAAIDKLKPVTKRRPIVLAASTHPGEDEQILDAFVQLAVPGAGPPLLVLVPRHPERGEAIAQLCADRGMSAARRSQAASPIGCDVYIADTLGELGLWFRLARLAIMGGSLVEGIGGHNPLEPARLGCPCVSGPFVANWRTVYDELEAAEAVARLKEASALDPYLTSAVLDGRILADMAAKARAYVEARDAEAREVPARVLELIP